MSDGELVLRLNPALDPASYAEAYARDGVVRVEGLFEPAVADRLAAMLERATPWDLIVSDAAGKAEVLDAARRQAVGPEALATKIHDATLRASKGFAYVYLGYPMISAVLEGRDPGHPLHDLTSFLNTPAFIAFGAAVTGETGLTKTDAQATFYRPGDFLTLHDDTGVGERRAAYTVGFTRRWRPDWGGQLLFHDDAGDINQGFMPGFNILTLFKVPHRHSVAPVAAYAGGPRLSVTGWLRDDPPSGVART
jgi:SM-20-related protein